MHVAEGMHTNLEEDPTISAYKKWNCLTTTLPAHRDQLLSLQSAVHFKVFSASGQFEVA